jgi:hypothetical protein
LKEIPLTKGKIAIVDDEDFEMLSRFKWCCSNRGYAIRKSNEDGKPKTMLMHRFILGASKGVFVDHIDGNPLNNQRGNLRLVSNRQNCLNQKIGVRNKSGYKGVWWNKESGKWATGVRGENKEKYFLGYFENKHDAARMYNFWAVDLYGEYARLNVINEEEIK